MDSGATMESTKEIISLGASTDALAICPSGDSSVSVMARMVAPRSLANFAVLMVAREYRGKLMASITSPGPIRNICSKISPAALDCTSVTFSSSRCM